MGPILSIDTTRSTRKVVPGRIRKYPHRVNSEKSTLAQRVDWIVDTYFGASRRALSLESGMSEAYVGKVIRGDIAESSVSLESLRKIAHAAKVDFGWLSSGQGQPRPGVDFEPLPPVRGRQRRAATPYRGEKSAESEENRSLVAENSTHYVSEYSDVESSMSAIDAAVAALNLDEGGEGYVGTTLRNEARSTGFRDRWEIISRAAELARVYVNDQKGRLKAPGHQAEPEPIREGGMNLPPPKKKR